MRPLAVAEACRFGGEALVERHVRGRGVTVGILGGEVLGNCEISYPCEGFDYEAKYKSGARYILPLRMSPTRVGSMEQLSLAAWQAVGCCGYAGWISSARMRRTMSSLRSARCPG